MQIELLEQRMEELELRVDGIERILPTLATRDELHAAIAASEHRIRTHVSDAIELSEQRTRTELRTHFDVVAESLRHDIRLVAEAVAALSERVP